jgi:hypothetical protein
MQRWLSVHGGALGWCLSIKQVKRTPFILNDISVYELSSTIRTSPKQISLPHVLAPI